MSTSTSTTTGQDEDPSLDLITDNPKKDTDEAPLHPLLEIIKNEKNFDLTEIQKVLDESSAPSAALESSDGAGMTALMHAAWKGRYDVVKLLIDQGADVNGGEHEHGYSALHFAALAGKVDICQLLVEKGAKTDHINTVKRTPAQMAAFVGNAACVSVINNFVPKEDVFYYTRKQPFEEQPKLPISLAKPIHKLVMSMNIHPVRVAMMLKENPVMLENLGTVCNILELMCDREFKHRRDVNEILSLKFHMLYYIVKDIKVQMEKDKQSTTEKKIPFIDRWMKSMIIGRETDGYPVFQEDFLRQGIKEFPHKESTLFKMLVMNFSNCTKYGESATAVEYINQAFNGQKGFKDHESCSTCGNEKAEKKCSNCKKVQYCDQACQKMHWFNHKKVCKNLKEGKKV